MRIQANPNVWEQLRNDAIHRTAANLRAANKGNSVVKKLGSFLLSHTFQNQFKEKQIIHLRFQFHSTFTLNSIALDIENL